MKKPLWVVSAAVVVLIALIIGVLLISANNPAPGVQVSGNGLNSPPTSANPIILKVPVTRTENSSGPLAARTLAGYTDKIIVLNSEFLIDPSDMESGSCAPKIKFRFGGIYGDSVALSVTAMEYMNGDFVPQASPKMELVSSGTCISVAPMCTDVSVSYCFEIKKGAEGIELYYSAKRQGVMPVSPP